MAFIKESVLRNKADDSSLIMLAERRIVKQELSQITIFLSHSHKDKALALGFKNLLAQFGIYIYIDWEDSELPDTPSRKTAEGIKNKIKELDLFILLATNNSLSSRWCPWEIGIADSYKGYENMLIVPVIPDGGDFEGNEYLQLYKRVEIDSYGKYLVLESGMKKFGTISFESEVPSWYCERLEDFMLKKIKK